VHFNHYGGSAAMLATALVNFCHQFGHQHEATAQTDQTDRLLALLADHDMHAETLTPDQAVELCRWADSLRHAYGDLDVDRQVEIVNALLEAGASRPFVSRHGGRQAHLHYFPEDPDIVTRVRAQTAAGLAHALCDSGGGRLGRCDRTDCGVVYLDTSRGGRRRFCSLRCANRVRVADHRARAAQVEPT
jgi:HPt (histidine-containing phosphotransfer) domain-containing protein